MKTFLLDDDGVVCPLTGRYLRYLPDGTVDIGATPAPTPDVPGFPFDPAARDIHRADLARYDDARRATCARCRDRGACPVRMCCEEEDT
jgi:hypothetical protein